MVNGSKKPSIKCLSEEIVILKEQVKEVPVPKEHFNDIVKTVDILNNELNIHKNLKSTNNHSKKDNYTAIDEKTI